MGRATRMDDGCVRFSRAVGNAGGIPPAGEGGEGQSLNQHRPALEGECWLSLGVP